MSRIDPSFYLGLAKELESKIRRLKIFTPHAPSVGFCHEEMVRSTIRAFLPSRFVIKTGFVFAEKGAVSRQIDLLILDENEPSGYFFQEGELVVVHPEAVVCSIEVKTRLDKNQFSHAVDNIYSVNKTALQAGMQRPPAGFIFAYSSATWSPQILDRWYRSVTVPDKIHFYPRMVFSLDQGRLDLRPEKPNWGHYRVIEKEETEVKYGSLSVFLTMIRKQMEYRAGKDANPYEYAHVEGQAWSHQYLRFGRGLIDPPQVQPS